MIRLADIFIIGPITILMSQYIKNDYLKMFVLVSGILTILYNLINFLRFTFYIEPSYLPFSLQSWFHPIHGKTQTQREINLYLMYPLFILSLFNLEKIPKHKQWIKTLFVLFLFGGVIYNLKYYLEIQQLKDKKRL